MKSAADLDLTDPEACRRYVLEELQRTRSEVESDMLTPPAGNACRQLIVSWWQTCGHADRVPPVDVVPILTEEMTGWLTIVKKTGMTPEEMMGTVTPSPPPSTGSSEPSQPRSE